MTPLDISEEFFGEKKEIDENIDLEICVWQCKVNWIQKFQEAIR